MKVATIFARKPPFQSVATIQIQDRVKVTCGSPTLPTLLVGAKDTKSVILPIPRKDEHNQKSRILLISITHILEG